MQWYIFDKYSACGSPAAPQLPVGIKLIQSDRAAPHSQEIKDALCAPVIRPTVTYLQLPATKNIEGRRVHMAGTDSLFLISCTASWWCYSWFSLPFAVLSHYHSPQLVQVSSVGCQSIHTSFIRELCSSCLSL